MKSQSCPQAYIYIYIICPYHPTNIHECQLYQRRIIENICIYIYIHSDRSGRDFRSGLFIRTVGHHSWAASTTDAECYKPVAGSAPLLLQSFGHWIQSNFTASTELVCPTFHVRGLSARFDLLRSISYFLKLILQSLISPPPIKKNQKATLVPHHYQLHLLHRPFMIFRLKRKTREEFYNLIQRCQLNWG